MTKLLRDDRLRYQKPRICHVCAGPMPDGEVGRTCSDRCSSQYRSAATGRRWQIRREPIPAKFMGFPDPRACQLVEAYTDAWDFSGSCWQSNLCPSRARTRITFEGKFTTLQRVSWLGFKGPIAEGLIVLNSCDNPMCANPDHLYLGSRLDKNLAVLERDRWRNQGRKITEDQWEEIRALYFFTDIFRQELADMFGVHPGTIKNIVNFRRGYANREQTVEEANAQKKKHGRTSAWRNKKRRKK